MNPFLRMPRVEFFFFFFGGGGCKVCFVMILQYGFHQSFLSAGVTTFCTESSISNALVLPYASYSGMYRRLRQSKTDTR